LVSSIFSSLLEKVVARYFKHNGGSRACHILSPLLLGKYKLSISYTASKQPFEIQNTKMEQQRKKGLMELISKILSTTIPADNIIWCG